MKERMEKYMMKLMEIASFSTETLAAQNMVYARRCGAYGAGNYALMAQVKEWAFLKGLMDDDAVILGIARDDMTKVAPENCRYDVCLLGAVDQTPNWLHQVFFDGGNYAVIEIPHTAEAVALVWQEGIGTAVERGYKVDDKRPTIERYMKAKVDQGLCEFLIPIMG